MCSTATAPARPCNFWLVVAERADGFPGAFEQFGVEPALVSPGQLSELGGHSKSEHEVGGWHLSLKLALNPLLALMVLVSAGNCGDHRNAAPHAHSPHAPQCANMRGANWVRQRFMACSARAWLGRLEPPYWLE